MSKRILFDRKCLALGMLALSPVVFAFNSGSTGGDGAFNPTESQSIPLPPNGVFNYASVNIPAGITITYQKNANNTPVTILASGDVTIAGTIDVSATQPVLSSQPSDMRLPGLGGPGGYNGGLGGQAGGVPSGWVNGLTGYNIGGAGLGPGAGSPGRVFKPISTGYFSASAAIGFGGGGAYGSAPPAAGNSCPTTPGVTYGSSALLPLAGGSGGGGGAGGSTYPGSGGGGGGGAILIAASGTIDVSGAILADGGVPLFPTLSGRGSSGGGGSGGAIRLVATTISGNGTLSATGAGISWSAGGTTTHAADSAGYSLCGPYYSNGSQNGGTGRIRLESETMLRTASTTPPYVGGAPSVLFVPGQPTLAISTIGSLPVPADPVGAGDVLIPSELANPVQVGLMTSGVTVGSTIKLTVVPASGVAYSVTSAPTTGTTESASTSVGVDIPGGKSILQASVTYTVVAAVGDMMSVYAQGERVEKVRLSTILGGSSMATLITVSGKEFEVPVSALPSGLGLPS